MYKSKKQNYPGLYGKFKRIDASNYEDEQQKHKRPDYSEDDNFENLDNLINSLKEKTKKYSDPIEEELPEEVQVKKVRSPVETDDEDDLEQLKKTRSIFDTVHVRNSKHGPKDPEDERFSRLITDSDFLDNLEDDLMSVLDTDKSRSKSSFSEIHKCARTLIMKLNALDDNQKEQLAAKEFFIKLADTISSIREQ